MKRLGLLAAVFAVALAGGWLGTRISAKDRVHARELVAGENSIVVGKNGTNVIDFDDGAGAGTLSGAAEGWLRYNNTTATFQQSVQGGAWGALSAGVTGSGAANQMAFWSSASALAGDADLTYNSTTNVLTLAGSIQNADGSAAAPAYSFSSSGNTDTGVYLVAANTTAISAGGTGIAMFATGGFQVSSGSVIAWSSGAINSASDVLLVRDAANTLAQRNGTAAQWFNIYNTFTDASNYERGMFVWTTNIFRIATASAGTGVTRALELGPDGPTTVSLRTNGTNRWQVDGSSGHLLAVTDNSYDVGATGATRPRDIWIARTLTQQGGSTATSGTVQSTLLSGTYSDGGTNSTTIAQALAITPTINYTGATRTGKVHILRIAPTVTSSATGINGSLVFDRVAANIGTNFGGAVRMYNTADEDTNYELCNIGFSSNSFYVQSTAAGTGTVRGLILSGATVTLNANGTDIAQVGTTAILASTGNSYDLGSASNSWRDVYVGTSIRSATNPASAGAVRLANAAAINWRNAANGADVLGITVNSSDQLVLASGGADIRWGVALVALGGGAAPTLGTIGGSGPTTAAQNTWMRVIDSTGAAFWVPAWK